MRDPLLSAALSPANTRGNALRWPAHALPRPAHRPPPFPLRAAPALILMDFHCERVMQKWCSVRMSPRGDTAGGVVWWYAKPHFSNTRCDRVFPWYTAPYTVLRFRWMKAPYLFEFTRIYTSQSVLRNLRSRRCTSSRTIRYS